VLPWQYPRQKKFLTREAFGFSLVLAHTRQNQRGSAQSAVKDLILLSFTYQEIISGPKI
jgi:hypothetical protein